MTLPTIQPAPFGDSKTAPRHHQPGNATVPANKAPVHYRQQQQQQCPLRRPSVPRVDRRRAVCSWSFGYGTLDEPDDDSTTPPPGANRRSIGSLLAPSGPHVAPSSGRRLDLFTMPGLKSLVGRRRARHSSGDSSSSPDASDNTASPLVKRETSCGNLTKPSASLAGLRKCETVLALTGARPLRSSGSTSSSASSLVELQRPLRPVNRLRRADSTESTSRLCSRCSSLLTLASNSRYSLNASTGGFVPVDENDEEKLSGTLLCKLCLSEVPRADSYSIEQCSCSFCKQCMGAYVEFEIIKGAYDISCPDAQCASQGVLKNDEIEKLVGADLLHKHKKYRLNREVDLDKNRTWCPRAGCETVCNLCPTKRCLPQCVHCPTCAVDFCSNCKNEWHAGISCEENSKQLAKQGKNDDSAGIPFDSDLIKNCPMCNVPIEKDEGCAQMMCKRCKHVFCWYCLASLDDDFLLRHYDKGPCKNKLGHSRASVIWHRTQVIGIFAGFGILLLVASPLLLLAAPCIVCCKCRICNAGTSKLDNEDELPDEENH